MQAFKYSFGILANTFFKLQAFRQFVRRLLQGKALSVEDAADVLSLKDNIDTLDDYVTALHLLSFAKVRFIELCG